MQIKPAANIEYSDFEQKSLQERNIKRAHRDFYIHDEVYMPLSSYNIENRIYAGVTQVVKLLVRGLPCGDGILYDKEKNDRITFVKTIYIYDAFMNDSIANVEERFQKAVLKPVIGLISAYTDTKQLVNVGITYPSYKEIENQYGITIYNFANESLMSIMCNPIMVQDGLLAGTSRLDVTDPRFNIVKHLDKTSGSESMNLSNHYYGNDLIRKGETNIHLYKSYYKDHNSFTEENLLNASKNMFSRNKMRFSYDTTGIAPYENNSIARATELMNKKRELRTLIIDMTKSSAYSLFESFTMVYETGKKSGFNIIKPPFKQYHIQYMNQKMIFVHTEFIKLCEHITEIFGRVRILLHVNDVEHVVRCIFLDEPPSDTRVVTLRMSKLECIHDYIYESLYRNQYDMDNFKMDHELDLLNYYGCKKADWQQFNFRERI
jgi:hypothetical protein